MSSRIRSDAGGHVRAMDGGEFEVAGRSRTGAERLDQAFTRARADGRLAVVIYLTVGFPDIAGTAALLRAALDGGADALELGVPFSDPMADGATVQRASEIALRQGVTLDSCLREGASVVAERDAAVLLMGYANPFLRYGPERLAAACARDGIAGLIVPDLPAEEAAEFDGPLSDHGLVRIDLYAPTTPDERLDRLLPRSRGFAYCVSLTGVTGARRGLGDDLAPFLARVRARTTLPLVVGFGISGPAQVSALRGLADGVVVGSAALDVVARAPAGDRERSLRELVRSLREAAG